MKIPGPILAVSAAFALAAGVASGVMRLSGPPASVAEASSWLTGWVL
jgi:hypothetical protein